MALSLVDRVAEECLEGCQPHLDRHLSFEKFVVVVVVVVMIAIL